MRVPLLRLECRFYAAISGSEPVRDWLKGLDRDVRQAIGSDIQRVQRQWPVSRPLVGMLGDGLFEVRTTVNTNIYRVLFSIQDGSMVLLHGFSKKTQKTPGAELAIAIARKADMKRAR